ncbi:hypothetical protein [Nonomuraea sp. NPDC049309]|uniref:hypothetical protein n=1 Tax=Nonomuraea sp. NPDC049309 TaxID=3364350 RepID=UPI00371615A3
MEQRSPIRAQIDQTEFDGATTEMVRQALTANKPSMLRDAAGEMLTAKRRLDDLVEVIDRHLRALDERWTTGEDAKTVKKALRALRGAAADVSTTISDQPVDAKQCPAHPKGVAPALTLQAHTLAALRGDQLPETPDRDVSILEGALQGGAAGAAVGVFGGGVGALIGGGIGLIAGGVTAIFTDGPFFNFIGDSKEEQDRKAAKEFLRVLSEATAANNQVFPAELRTDIPVFDAPPVTPPGYTYDGPGFGDGKVNGAAADLAGLDVPNQDGLFDPSQHRIPGMDGLGGLVNEHDGTGLNGTGLDGVNVPDGSGLDGTGTDGTGTDGTGQNGAGLDGTNALNGVNVPDATGLDGTTGLPDPPSTSLASLPDPSQFGGHPNPNLGGTPATTGIGSGYVTGPGTGGGGGYGGAFGGVGAGGGAAAAGMRGLGGLGGGTPMMPFVPAGGQKREERKNEMERAAYVWDDEDYFTSDVPTIDPHITGDAKGRA